MIELIYEFMLIGLIGGLMGVLYNYSLSSGTIFGSIGQLLTKWSDKGGWLGWISNPLGAHIYCSTTWITIILCIFDIIFYPIIPDLPGLIIAICAALGVQHLIIKIVCLIDSKIEEE